MAYKQNFDLKNKSKTNSLKGKFLVASPFGGFNQIFNKSLIYITEHANNLITGMIVNQNVVLDKKLTKIIGKVFFNDPSIVGSTLEIYLGGPVNTEKGCVIHSSEYRNGRITKCSEDISISYNVEAVRDILQGKGPKQSLVVMGYTTWKQEELEKEMQQNLWIVAQGNNELIFETHYSQKWEAALRQVGIDSTLFCTQVGHG
jgi:putative transcriptional regulator